MKLKRITPEEIAEYGVVNAPDKLVGNPHDNKMIFDRLIREVVAGAINALIDQWGEMDEAEDKRDEAEEQREAAEQARQEAENLRQNTFREEIGEAKRHEEGAYIAMNLAAENAHWSEAFAVGQENGVDIDSTNPAYRNNAKFYAEQAKNLVGGDDVFVCPNILVSAADWSASTRYDDFPWEATAQVKDINGQHVPFVVFDHVDAATYGLATVADTADESLTIYSVTMPERDILIPATVFMSEGAIQSAWKALSGGEEGEVLAKQSGKDHDFKWMPITGLGAGVDGERGLAIYRANKPWSEWTSEYFDFSDFQLPNGYVPKVNDLVLTSNNYLCWVYSVNESAKEAVVASFMPAVSLNGGPGPAGDPGVSPNISILQGEQDGEDGTVRYGTVIEVTNPDGSEVYAFVPDGRDGDTGPAGADGAQGKDGERGLAIYRANKHWSEWTSEYFDFDDFILPADYKPKPNDLVLTANNYLCWIYSVNENAQEAVVASFMPVVSLNGGTGPAGADGIQGERGLATYRCSQAMYGMTTDTIGFEKLQLPVGYVPKVNDLVITADNYLYYVYEVNVATDAITLASFYPPVNLNGAEGAAGPAGADGNTPYIGANGNWWIAGEDTGVAATGGGSGGGASVQADLSENDETKLSYVRGRTHWKEPVAPTVFVEEENAAFAGKSRTFIFQGSSPFRKDIIGKTFEATWKGEVYTMQGEAYAAYAVVGNKGLAFASEEDTGEPCCFVFEFNNATPDKSDIVTVYRVPGTGERISYKLARIEPDIYHKLDPGYLPEGAPYVQTAKVGQTIVVSEVDEDGKPTKWEAVTLEAGSLTVETITVGSDSGEEPENVAVTGLSLDLTSYSAKIGGGFYINPVVSPGNATNKAVTWKSSATTIATVDGNGYVECLAEGNAVITCTTVDGGFTASCAVSVAAAESGGDSGGDDSGDDSGGTAGETIRLSTLARTSGLMTATGTVSGLGNTYHVEIPYTEGMFVSTGSNVAWVDVNANNVPIVVLDNGAYSVPELTWGEASKSVGGKYATQCTATLSGYSDSAIVYVSFLAGGTEGSTLETNMDKAGFYYYIPGGET